MEKYVHGSEERLIQVARGDVLEAASVLKRSNKKKTLGGESSTWSVFEAD